MNFEIVSKLKKSDIFALKGHHIPAQGWYVMPFQGKKVTKKNTPKSNVRLFGNAPTFRLKFSK
ncbi:hypothetical protein MHK_000314 [Candidatus Magnetomorum sp. HK-1]|nr:hypothetical protein MHK_000314 [Candidatus Magnetomorum sp. HK-1]